MTPADRIHAIGKDPRDFRGEHRAWSPEREHARTLAKLLRQERARKRAKAAKRAQRRQRRTS